jgi:hypothetical protein
MPPLPKSLFRVHFTWKEKEYSLKANSLDMTHPYFVAIKDLVLPRAGGVLINPADDDIRKLFGEVRQLMLPLQSVSLIEEFTEDPDGKKEAEDQGKKEVLITNRFPKKPS